MPRIPVLFVAASLLLAVPAWAQSELKVSFTPSGTGSGTDYEGDEKSIIVAWVEDQARNFVATIDGHGSNANHADSLIEYIDQKGQLQIDALSQATLQGYAPLSYYWDLTDEQGQPVGNGTYYIRMESTDKNNPDPGENNLYELQIAIADANATETGAGGGFANITLEYTYVDPALCGNDALDEGEKCDDTAGAEYACPAVLADCGAPADPCVPYEIVGDALICTAECVAGTPITAPIDDDACCPDGYYYDDDNDCEPEGGGNPNEDPNVDDNGRSKVVQGGCASTGTSGPLGLLMLCALLLVRRRP